MKQNAILLLAAIPLIAITALWLLGQNTKKNLTKTSTSIAGSEIKIHQTFQEPTLENEKYESKRDEVLADLSLKRLVLAEQASKLKASDFGNNSNFLLNKHKNLFDAWGLSNQQRNEFVHILSEQSVRLAEISLKSSNSWPVEVGYAGNRKADNEHARKQLAEMKIVRAETKQKLVALVGSERVQEFESKQTPKHAEPTD